MHLARSRTAAVAVARNVSYQLAGVSRSRVSATKLLTPNGAGNSSRALSSTSRVLADVPPSTAVPSASTTTTTAAAPSPGGNGNGNGKKQSRYRAFLQHVGRVTLVTLVGTTGVFYYYTQKDKHPGAQLPFDESKKTLVVLGSGWGASSLLKTLDTEDYNVVVVSPKNYFLFTPLLPSVAVGTISPRSIIQPTRYITRHKKRVVSVVEAEAKEVDPVAKTVTVQDTSEIRGLVTERTIPYDYLVVAVGAEVQTFNIPGVQEHACFMKELHDAEVVQRRFMDCVETAAFPGQSQEEIDRLLHVVVVGGGPTGVELSGELHDFLSEDLRSWYPELASRVRLTLVEALPSVLPSFSKQLIDYTVSAFKEEKIDVKTGTKVQKVKPDAVVVETKDGEQEIPCGLLVWAGGNKGRKVSMDLMAKFPTEQTNQRGISIDDHLVMKGSDGSIFALGDCTFSQYAPTAQVASQQGAYLARVLKQKAKRDTLTAELTELQKQDLVQQPEGADERKDKLEKVAKQLEKQKVRPFMYSHQGSLAYIGSEKAIADLPFLNGNVASAGVATFLFWRSAYISTLFSLRNRVLVANDWLKVKLFGRDVSRD